MWDRVELWDLAITLMLITMITPLHYRSYPTNTVLLNQPDFTLSVVHKMCKGSIQVGWFCCASIVCVCVCVCVVS